MAKKTPPKKIKQVRKTAKKKVSKVTRPEEKNMSEIKSLINFIARVDVDEVEIKTKDISLHVKRYSVENTTSTAITRSNSISLTSPTPPPTTNTDATVNKSNQTEEESQHKNTTEIISPMIGTFYRSSNPEVSPFASVGETVNKGQVVCIIEAMKLFNEIESEVSGKIVKVLVENASPVEYGQALFLVEQD